MSNKADDLSLVLPILVFPIERKPKPALITISTFVAFSFFMATLTSLVLELFQKHITESAAPISETEAGGIAALINLIYMLLAVVLMTLFLIVMIRYGKIALIRILIAGLMSYLIFTFTLYMGMLTGAYFLVLAYNYLNFAISSTIVDILYYSALVLSAIFVGIYLLSATKGRLLTARNIILTINVTWMGVWMSWNMGELTPIALLIGFALYDLYSVFKGPLKQLAETLGRDIGGEKEEEFGLGFGLGDVFFYSFAIGYSLAVLTLIETIVVCVVLLAGTLVTIILLFKTKAEALPALPIPVLSAVALILMFRYVV